MSDRKTDTLAGASATNEKDSSLTHALQSMPALAAWTPCHHTISTQTCIAAQTDRQKIHCMEMERIAIPWVIDCCCCVIGSTRRRCT